MWLHYIILHIRWIFLFFVSLLLRIILVKKNPGHHPLSNQPEKQSIIQAAITNALQRPLTQYESDILVYPRLCMVCLNGLQVSIITFVIGKVELHFLITLKRTTDNQTILF